MRARPLLTHLLSAELGHLRLCALVKKSDQHVTIAAALAYLSAGAFEDEVIMHLAAGGQLHRSWGRSSVLEAAQHVPITARGGGARAGSKHPICRLFQVYERRWSSRRGDAGHAEN